MLWELIEIFFVAFDIIDFCKSTMVTGKKNDVIASWKVQNSLLDSVYTVDTMELIILLSYVPCFCLLDVEG